MKFSKGLRDKLDDIENLASLPTDHPDVIMIRQMAKEEMANMTEKRKQKSNKQAKEILKHISKQNITRKMYFYLLNKEIKVGDINKQLGSDSYRFQEWRKIKKIDLDSLFTYLIMDIDTNKVVRKFNNIGLAAAYLNVRKSDITNSVAYERVLQKHYIVDKEYVLNPTLTEAKTFKYQDTFAYWLERDNLKKAKRTAINKKRAVKQKESAK